MSELHDIEVRYNFTEPEILKIGRNIARLSQDLQNKEDEKKEVMAHFKHELDAIKNNQSHAVNCVNNGFEMRIMTTRMHKNYDTNEREFYSLNGELVHTEDFKRSNYQHDIKDDMPDQDGVEVRLTDFDDQENTPYQQLLYSQSLQSFYVDEPGAPIENRPIGDDWTVLVMPTYPVVIAGFLARHPELGGSFLTVKTAFENYLKEFFSKPKDEASTDADTSSDDELDNPLTDDEPTSPDPVPPGTDGGGMAPDSPQEFENDLKQDDGIYSADQPADGESTEDKNAVGYGKSVTRVRKPGGRFGSKKETNEV